MYSLLLSKSEYEDEIKILIFSYILVMFVYIIYPIQLLCTAISCIRYRRLGYELLLLRKAFPIKAFEL